MLKIRFLSVLLSILLVSQAAVAQVQGSGRAGAGNTSKSVRGRVDSGNAVMSGVTEVMTDKQIVKFIKDEQKKGTPNSEIIAQLLLKGVTEAQLIRVRDEYLSAQASLQP